MDENARFNFFTYITLSLTLLTRSFRDQTVRFQGTTYFVFFSSMAAVAIPFGWNSTSTHNEVLKACKITSRSADSSLTWNMGIGMGMNQDYYIIM